MITARYRTDYPGEFVVVESKWSGGKKQQTREWVPNPIENQHISGRAACIGSGVDREYFDYTRLQRHRGGLLGSKKLQTYGVGSIALEMRLDFAVDIDFKNLRPLLENKYCETNVVYTTGKQCIDHPGEFYLIPQHSKLSNLALPLYLAAFDGHKEIFMIGYHKETPGDNNAWMEHVESVIRAYSTTKFWIVGAASVMPESWTAHPNTENISVKDFISYCDV